MSPDNLAIYEISFWKETDIRACGQADRHRRAQQLMPHSLELTVINLRNPPYPTGELANLLSPDEQERAARFRLTHLKERFLVGRGMLRQLLGQACNISPSNIAFSYSAQGKPSVPEINFNASHSGDLWACAISRGSAVGVDIEQIRPVADYEAIARRFFAPRECESLAQFDDDQRLTAFFRCWTRKEAYVKGLGEGLARGFATFTVSCGEEIRSTIDDSLNGDEWSVESFVPAHGYVGSLATR